MTLHRRSDGPTGRGDLRIALSLATLLLVVGVLAAVPSRAQDRGSDPGSARAGKGQPVAMEGATDPGTTGRDEAAEHDVSLDGERELSTRALELLRGVAPVTGPRTMPIGSGNTRMNNPSGDLDTEVQSAVQVAASQNRVVACWNDSRGLNTPSTAPPNTLVGFGWSADYGVTWTDGGDLPRLTADSQVLNARLTSDGQGNFYLVARITTNLSGTNGTAIGLWKGLFTTGGAFSWGPPSILNSLSGTTELLDHPFVLATPGAPTLYVAWTRLVNGQAQGRIEIVRSDDGGTNWTSPVIIDQNTTDRRPGHVRLAHGPSGQLYAVWLAFADFLYYYCSFLDHRQTYEPIYFASSTDFGQTWTAPVVVLNQGMMSRLALGPGEFASFETMTPSLAVDTSGGPLNGRICVAAAHSTDWTVSAGTGVSQSELNPNEWPSEASVVLNPGDDATGTWTATGESDYWAIDLVAGQNVLFHLEPPGFTGCPGAQALSSTTMRLYASDATPASAHPDTLLANQTRTNGIPNWIHFTCQRTGRYFLRLAAGNSAALVGPYLLRTRLVTWATPTALNPTRDAKDVVAIESTDGGLTWSNPILVNSASPAGIIESQPTVLIDEAGVPRYLWHDRREGILNPGQVHQALPTDIFMATGSATTPGIVSDTGLRLTNQSGAFAGFPRSTIYPGNFNGAWQAGGRFYAGWADGRSRSGSGGTSVDAYLNVLDFYPPETTILTGPAEGDTLYTSSALFTYTGSDSVTPTAGLHYELRLDLGEWQDAGTFTAYEFFDLTAGTHTVSVRARDALVSGNVDASPATRSFYIDPGDPETVLESGPAEGSITGATVASFEWTGSDLVTPTGELTYSWSLDGAPFSAAQSETTLTLTGLGDGTHTFRVRAHDGAGHIDPTPAERTWTIDDTPPVVTIDSGPAAGSAIAMTTAAFAWHAVDDRSPADSLTYSWQLDEGTASPFDTTRSASLTGLLESAHTFVVRARDQFGNEGSASRTFTVDLTEPNTTLTSGPAEGAAVNSLTVSFAWSGTDAVGGLQYSTRVDEGPWSAFSAATGGSFAFGTAGPHAFAVRARDAAGNVDSTPAVRNFSIDLGAPTVDILAGVAEGALLDTNIVSFGWTGSDAETPRPLLTFSSTLDAIPFPAATADSTRTFTGLADGAHTFRVRTHDPAGNLSPEATRSFTVDNLPPSITLLLAPAAGSYTTDTTASFEWSLSDLVTADSLLQSQWRLDGGAFSPFDTTTSAFLPDLDEGTHTLTIRARDQVGKIASISRSWTVDRVPPTVGTPTLRLFDANLVQMTVTGSDNRVLDGYRIQVATDVAFSTLVHDLDITTTGTFQFTGTNGASYFARARARDGAGNLSPFSPTSNEVALAQLPDLVVSSVQAPPSGNSGQNLQVTWIVTNTGAGATQVPTWYDDVYLSVGPAWNSGTSVLLGRFENTAHLGPGEAYATTRDVLLPRGAGGQYYVHVRTDNTDLLAETSSSNNTGGSSQFTVFLSDHADLRTTQVVTSPTAFSGDSIEVTWTVRNQGTGRTDVNEWWDTVFLSPDSVLSYTIPGTGTIRIFEQPLARFRHVGALEADSSYSRSESLTLPESIQGDYWIFVVTDLGVTAHGQTVPLDGEVFENVSQFNNWNNGAIEVTLTPPCNLVVAGVSAPTAAESGVAFFVGWTVLNNGLNPTVEEGWTDRIYLSTDAVLDDGVDLVLANAGHTGILVRDATYVASASVKIPNGMSGNFYILVRTDAGNGVVELSDADNVTVAAVPLVVTVAPWPDLVPTIVEAPAAAGAGTSIGLSWEVANEGAAAAGGSWNDRVILSTSPVSAVGMTLGTFPRPTALPPGGVYSRTVSLPLPTSLSGTHYLHVRTDVDNQLFEHTGEANNGVASAGILIDPYPPADLAVSDLVVPASGFSGASLSIRWTTSNLSGAETAASSWVERAWLSTDTALGGDQLLYSMNASGKLAGGAAVVRDRTAPLPNGLTGTFYLIVEVDPGHANHVDPDFGNNTGVSTTTTVIQLTPPPDLVVSQVSLTGSPIAGQPATVEWRTTNAGIGATVAPDWDVAVYLSTNQYLDGYDIHLRSVPHVGTLGPSDFVDESLEIEFPIYTSGAYYLIVDVDVNGEVYEAGAEVNRGHVVANVVLPPPADLVVTDVQGPLVAEPGLPLTVSWTVENVGQNPATGLVRDGIFVSADTLFSPDDPLLGIRSRTINLSPGQAVRTDELITLSAEQLAGLVESITEPLPGVSPGSYYLIVRTNLRNNIREETLENNNTTGATPVFVDIPELQLEVPAPLTLRGGDSRYLKLVAGAGFDLRIGVSSSVSAATNELYVAFDRAPTPGDFDASGPPTFTSSPVLLVPSSQDGTYYVLVRAMNLPAGVDSQVVTVLARALPFSITSASPEEVGCPGDVTMTITGAGFRDTTVFELSLGGLHLAASRMTLVNTTLAKVRFQFPAGLAGNLSLTARNGQDVAYYWKTIPIESARALAILTTPVHQEAIRNNAASYFAFRYRNIANVDIPHFRARLMAPGSARVVAVQSSPGFLRRSTRYPELFAPTVDDGVLLFNEAEEESVRLFDFETTHLPPDAEVIVTMSLADFATSPFSILSFTELSDQASWMSRESARIEAGRQALLADPAGVDPAVLALAGNPESFRTEVMRADHVANGLLDSTELALLPPVGEPGPADPPLTGIGAPGDGEECVTPGSPADCSTSGEALQCGLPACLACFPADLPMTIRLGGGFTVAVPGTTCAGYAYVSCIAADVVAPCDPNTLTGPPGFGTERWVGVSQPMPFTVNFENLSGVATAPAQVVRVNLPLHANLDIATFRLGSFGFGAHVIEVPPNRSSYTVEPYFSDLNLRVRVTAGIDITARTAFWTFTSIDPATGQLPTNPQVGFLPVNDQFGRGQGFANFTIHPASAAATGAPVVMQANIKFDVNAPVYTNTTSHTIDGLRPSSAVSGAPLVVNQNTLRVNWVASDDPTGSGVGSYDLYMQQDGGGFQLAATGLTQNSATLTLSPGKTYGFYTIARDNSGNAEPLKSNAEASATLGAGVGVPDGAPPVQDALLQNAPNPFRSTTTIHFELAREERVDLQVFDVAGRLVARYLDGDRLPAGRHVLNLDASALGSGVYFYHLRAGEKVFTRKMLVLR